MPLVFHSEVDFFPLSLSVSLPSSRYGKRRAEPHSLTADCTVWIYANPRLSASKLSSVYVPVVGCNAIILARRGLNVWKFASCH